jgi:lysyl-tRNA synthetase class 2
MKKKRVKVAGRIASPPRVMGRVAFVHLSDGTSRLQIYVRMADVKVVDNRTGRPTRVRQAGWQLLKLLDHGDFIGVKGYLFVTRTGELSVHVERIQFLAKALVPMPHKMHGINDPEIRRRQRYVDLIAGSLKVKIEEEEEEEDDEEVKPSNLTTREVFELRSRVVREIRRFLDEHSYIEVETPMLTPLATGAAAKPFKTHHNALDIDLYARIAPELYLKRLVVGGFEKVYELNRNFRNEGISAKHNPEFTMLEFYMAYADVSQMMDFAEELLRSVVRTNYGDLVVKFTQPVAYHIGRPMDSESEFEIHGVDLLHKIDFSRRFARMSMKEAIATHLPDEFCHIDFNGRKYDKDWLDDPMLLHLLHDLVKEVNEEFNWPPKAALTEEIRQRVGLLRRILKLWPRVIERLGSERDRQIDEVTAASDLAGVFELIAEKELIQPTFITDFPKPISPLSKASPFDPSIAERFEYFVGGLESANGFSELNDPEEQYRRFNDQVQQRERGDAEAMVMDEDYIRALSYGMPPAAGIGVGIDRLVMLLANKQSIRDVILFPHMRPEQPGQ